MRRTGIDSNLTNISYNYYSLIISLIQFFFIVKVFISVVLFRNSYYKLITLTFSCWY